MKKETRFNLIPFLVLLSIGIFLRISSRVL